MNRGTNSIEESDGLIRSTKKVKQNAMGNPMDLVSIEDEEMKIRTPTYPTPLPAEADEMPSDAPQNKGFL